MLPAESVWRGYWDRHRMRIGQAAGLFLLVIAHPGRSNALFFLGFLIAIAGEAIRFWTAGHIHRIQELSARGPYAVSRHPLYFGSFVMSVGIAIICTSRRHWFSAGLIWAALFTVFHWLYDEKIELEETRLQERFGAEFERYRRDVPRFWPDYRRWREALETADFSFERALKNGEQRTVWALLALALFLRFKMVYF